MPNIDIQKIVPYNDNGDPSERSRLVNSNKGRRYRRKKILLVAIVVLAMLISSIIVSSSLASQSTGSDEPTLTSSSIDMCTNGDISLTSGGQSRKFEFYKPSSASKSSPIIFVWHGISATPADIESKIKMKPEADKKGWVLVYPYGTGFPTAFNGMGCCNVNGPDDVQYAKDVINYLENNECGDVNLVFSTGFSNGGFMTHRLGCEAGNRNDGTPWFKGLAPHSGLIGDYTASTLPPINDYKGCTPATSVPIISLHGTADQTVGYNGYNPNPFSSAKWYGFEDSMTHWRNLHRCDTSKDVITTPAEGKKNVLCNQFRL